MNKISIAFTLTTLSGLSTLLGLILLIIPIKNKNKLIAGSLSFASGVMLCVSITDLLPESIKMLEQDINGIITCSLSFLFVITGIILSTLVDKKISYSNQNNSLYKVGLISMIAIILHNIPEGIITFISTTKNTTLGINLAIAIAIHNIPEGISIGIPIYYATKSKKKALLYTFLSAISEPLGALITCLFLLPFINNIILGSLFSFIAGIMIQIAMIELLPKSKEYKYKRVTNLYFFIGIICMLLKIVIN